MQIDGLDKKILSLIQKNSRLSIENISAEIGLSQPAIQRRLKKLRSSDIITREVAVLNPKKIRV